VPSTTSDSRGVGTGPAGAVVSLGEQPSASSATAMPQRPSGSIAKVADESVTQRCHAVALVSFQATGAPATLGAKLQVNGPPPGFAYSGGADVTVAACAVTANAAQLDAAAAAARCRRAGSGRNLARSIVASRAGLLHWEASPRSLSEVLSLRERFDAGTGLVALGAVVLLVSLFVDWYSRGGDAWAVFEFVDVLLAVAAATAIVAIVPRYAGLQRALPAIAFAALFVVAVQIIDAPPSARGDRLEAGAWLALAATALMAVGATLSAASISVTVDVRGRDRRRRSAAIDARERERERDEAAAAAAEDESAPADARRPRRRVAAGATAAGASAAAGRSAADPEPPVDEPPRRSRRGADADAPTRPADEPADEHARPPRRVVDGGGAPAPHATDPPASPEPDPDRTQALEPVDRPREDT
jgi:hypothetical protein